MKKPIEIINYDYSDYLHLDYSLTNVCNYKCWYCGPELNSGTIAGYKTFDLFENDWYHFTGWSCNVGVDRLGINGKHDIVGFCGQYKIYGLSSPLSMFDPDLHSKFTPDLVRPTICEQASCACSSDTKVSKIKFYDR